MKLNKKIKTIFAILVCISLGFIYCGINYNKQDENDLKSNISTYNMTEEQIKNLPTTNIIEKNIIDEQATEQATTENENFQEQGEIAYNGSSEYPNISLGNYAGLTYYSQLDNRWSNLPYTSVGNINQSIGSSGCGPTSASMIVTAIKGTITPPEMSNLFVQYGYRSADSGTYWSAFRWVADTFNIGYQETTDIQKALQLLDSKHYIVASCGNGLFTTGGHYIVLVGYENGYIKVYDPYLYSGKFDTSTRRGKAIVEGNTVYVTPENFINYANAKGFFIYEHNENVSVNNSAPVTTSSYTRYVIVSTRLLVRNTPAGSIINSLGNGTEVQVYETSGNWSRIGNNQWIASNYLSITPTKITASVTKTIKGYSTGIYKVTASTLKVRTGPGTKYSSKTYKQLSANARSQNRKLGNYYSNGYLKGITCTVTKISGNWGLTASGWICLDYTSK